MDCKNGYKKKRSYKKKNGTVVKESCIQELSVFLNENKNSPKCEGGVCKVPTACPTGKVLREGYVKKEYEKSTYNKNGRKISTKTVKAQIVPTECVTKKERKRGKNIIQLDPRDHLLGEYNYINVRELSQRQRRLRLNRLLKHLIDTKGETRAYNYIIKALTARSTLLKRRSPVDSKIFKEDQEWISEKYNEIKRKRK